MSILVIAEKPSVARDIAKVLKCTNKGDGFLYGNNYVISWALGHLVGLCDPDEYNSSYKKWRFDSLPIIPQEIKLKALPKTKKQLSILKKLMNDKDTSEIICATDSGREGELIFRYIYVFCNCNKPFKRLWISSLTDSSIKKGFDNLKEGHEYDFLYESARCRSEADWLVGINTSRAFSLKYGVFLTIGRVQTPTLSLLVTKKKEIDAFKPEEFWEVIASFQQDFYKGLWFDPQISSLKYSDQKKEKSSAVADGNEEGQQASGNYSAHMIKSEQKAKDIISAVKGEQGLIEDVKKEVKKTPHPLLYDLTELQRDCNRKFGFSASKTLDIAQSLYERHKIITYPRTDSRYLTQDMTAGIKKVLLSFQNEYAKLAQYPLSLPELPITKRIADNSKVTDHHAIIPTGKREGRLTEQEAKVYDLIVRRLIAAFYPEYVYSTTKVVTVVNGEHFLSKGIVVNQAGWTEVLGRERNDNEPALPDFSIGDCFQATSATMRKKKTSPPKPYTEATLLSAMEHAGRFVDDEELKAQLKDSGLGTPATRASIIERLIAVGYLKRANKNLIPTEKAMKLIEITPLELKSPETTAKWERALSSISKGKMEPKRFCDSIERYVRYIIREASLTRKDVIFDAEPVRTKGGAKKLKEFGKCPICGGSIFENSKSFYCDKWRTGCRFSIWKNALERSGSNVTGDLVTKLLKDGEIENFPVVLSSTGQSGFCTLRLDTDGEQLLNIVNFKQ